MNLTSVISALWQRHIVFPCREFVCSFERSGNICVVFWRSDETAHFDFDRFWEQTWAEEAGAAVVTVLYQVERLLHLLSVSHICFHCSHCRGGQAHSLVCSRDSASFLDRLTSCFCSFHSQVFAGAPPHEPLFGLCPHSVRCWQKQRQSNTCSPQNETDRQCKLLFWCSWMHLFSDAWNAAERAASHPSFWATFAKKSIPCRKRYFSNKFLCCIFYPVEDFCTILIETLFFNLKMYFLKLSIVLKNK